jgi:hypothetical protein
MVVSSRGAVSLRLVLFAGLLVAAILAVALERPRPSPRAPASGGDGREAAAAPARAPPTPRRHVGDSEWAARLTELGRLQSGDPQGAREIVRTLADYFTATPRALANAHEELLRLDRGGAVLHASVLATAIGLVPRADAAEDLMGLLNLLTNPEVVQAAVRSLAQNRYGVPVASGAWTMSGDLCDVNAPIREERVRGGLVDFVRRAIGSTDPVRRRTAEPAIEVLAFSVGDPAVQAFLVELVRRRELSESTRRAAVDALGFSADPAVLRMLCEEADRAASPETQASILHAIARNSGPGAATFLLDRAERPGLDARDLANAVAALQRLRDAGGEAAGRIDGLVRTTVVRNDAPPVQSAGIGLAARRIALGSDAAFDAVVAVARDPRASMANRIQAVRVLRPPAAARPRAREVLGALIRDGDVNVDLRAAAVAQWAALTDERDGATAAAALQALRSEVDEPALRSAFEDALRALRRRDVR